MPAERSRSGNGYGFCGGSVMFTRARRAIRQLRRAMRNAGSVRGGVVLPQELLRVEVDEGRCGGDERSAHLEDVVGRAEGGCRVVQGVRLRLLPLPRVEPPYEHLEGGDRLGGREGAVPGTVDEDLPQE